MKLYKLDHMVGGWFVGDFNPAAHQTSDFEVGYKRHPKGEKWETHYHKEMTEINCLILGKMKLQNTIIEAGDIFVLHPGEIADPIFLEDCELIVIKTPSVPGDKVIIK